MTGSKTQIRRIVELHKSILNGEYPNAETFAARQDVEVSSRTIKRDIQFLRDQMRAPLSYDQCRKGYCYTDSSFSLPSIPMTGGDLLALAIGIRALESYQDTPIAAKLEELFTKLSGFLPAQVSVSPNELFTQFSFSAPPSIPMDASAWEVVFEGLLSKRQLEIVYSGKAHRVHPLHIANLQGQWYLFVRFYDYDNFKQLSMGRIKSAKLLKDAVDAVDFDIQEMLRDTFGRFAGDNESMEVELEFDPMVAESVLERQWHADQKTDTLENGAVRLLFKAKGKLELKRWIMAWGRHCKVISPQSIKEMVAEEVRAMNSQIEQPTLEK